MKSLNVPFIKPHFPESRALAEDYGAMVTRNWYTNFGPYEREFRESVATFVDGHVAVCTAGNATQAIDLALGVLFTKTNERRRVLVASFTFAAGPARLLANGYIPVFIDIDESWQPDSEAARLYLSENASQVSGILLTNTFGVGNPRIDVWENLAAEYAIPMIIDSAAGFGSRYDQRERLGRRGDCEIFSLHATKPFAVGEGGLIISRDGRIIEESRRLSNFGFDETRAVVHIGTNAKMSEFSAAIGLRQLISLEERLNHRRNSLRSYKGFLSEAGYRFQDNDELSSVPFVSTAAPNSDLAELAHAALLRGGVEARRYYRPLHDEPIIRRQSLCAGDLAHTQDLAARILSLPLHDGMDDALVADICRIIVDVGLR